VDGVRRNQIPPSSWWPKGDDDGGLSAMHLEFSPNFSNDYKGWMDPTNINAPIKPETIIPRRIPAPMEQVEFWTKVVIVGGK
jgi:hypothetical protein